MSEAAVWTHTHTHCWEISVLHEYSGGGFVVRSHTHSFCFPLRLTALSGWIDTRPTKPLLSPPSLLSWLSSVPLPLPTPSQTHTHTPAITSSLATLSSPSFLPFHVFFGRLSMRSSTLWPLSPPSSSPFLAPQVLMHQLKHFHSGFAVFVHQT